MSISRSRSARCSEPDEARARSSLLLVPSAIAHADPDPKRKVVVLEYRVELERRCPASRARSSTTLGKQTSLQLLGPDQTRAVYGDHLEQVIVRCAGDAECIARIGEKVGAAEVILVGVSELGDVILTMQRIDVASHTVQRARRGLARERRRADRRSARLLPREDPAAGRLHAVRRDRHHLEPGRRARHGRRRAARHDADPVAQAARAGDVRRSASRRTASCRSRRRSRCRRMASSASRRISRSAAAAAPGTRTGTCSRSAA